MTQEDKDKIKQVIEITVLYHESCDSLTAAQIRSLMEALTTRVLYLIDHQEED